MEDGEMLAADCIVICCCCQCLLLQIFVFILLKLPQKLLRKTKAYAKKFKARWRASTKVMRIEMTRYEQDSFRSLGNSFRIDIHDFFLVESLQLSSMNEVESVLEELSSRGEFAFGSFWGVAEAQSCPEEIDYDSIGFHLMELFGSSANVS